MKRSKHNLSHMHLTTADPGMLIPIGCVPALPGDTFQHHTNCVVRMSPMLAPIMHQLTCRIHHFFVPNRLIWNKGTDGNGTWEDFITGGDDGTNAELPPQITTTGTAKDLLDYLGIPLVAGIDVNAMPVRAFNICFNEYYRDQDLVTERDLDDLTVPKIAWEKDYFTSARPFLQKGPEITIPLGDTAPVKGIGKSDQTYGAGAANVYETGNTGTTAYGANTSAWVDGVAGGSNSWRIQEDPNNAGFPGIFADLANATGANINDVRRAFALQRYQEARARYGSRYTEYLRYLGVRNPADSRLQRPEFLGGGHTQLNISEVLNTAGVPGTDPVGSMLGHGIAAMRSNKYRRFIEEHGYVISMFSVRPKSMYLDGIHREYLRTSKEDFFQRELAHIGQQEIFNNEVYADVANGMDTFGYQDRYREYREHPSRVSADFRSTLDYWHMGRAFGAAPVLNNSFVECDPTKRVFAVPGEHVLWVLNQHKLIARRFVGRDAMPRVL